MGEIIDLTGKNFGRLTVLGPAPRPKNIKDTHKYWECECTCGNQTVVNGRSLRQGQTRSCGCLQKEKIKKHTMSYTKLYKKYDSMKQRCTNPNNVAFQHYGGRGIKICSEWLGESGFQNFAEWSLANGYSDDLSIDRIDVDGNYEPSNCRFADDSIQSFNRRPQKNSTGHTGVCKRKNRKYEAYIAKNGKMHHLGYFDTLEEAIEAREKAERKLYPELYEEST
ncbi:MAG: AP2 domain-containing protein [Clostridia bacterium]|nr:AP2 domain-containing protein [Clostridia bacterium]